MNLVRSLWDDECGAVVSSELLIIATIVSLGLMAAWATLRNSVIMKIEEQAEWISGEDLEDGEFTQPSGEGSGFYTLDKVLDGG